MRNKLKNILQKFYKFCSNVFKGIILMITILTISYPILFLSPLSPYVDDLVVDIYNKLNKSAELEEIPQSNKAPEINTDANLWINDDVEKEEENIIGSLPIDDYDQLKNDYIKSQYRRDVDTLKDDHIELLDYLVFEITKFNKRIEIPSGYKVNTEDLSKIVNIIRMDFPELFMLNLTYNYETIGDRVVAYSPDYKMDKSEYEELLKKVNIEVFKIVEKVDKMNPYEQLLYVHNYLLQNSKYTASTLNNNNICGIILEGEGACEGYSSSFMYITNVLGFKTSQVFGEELNNKSNLAHSWNLVEFEGQAYYFDVTWDYTDNKIHQTYFGMTYDEMIMKHDISLHKTNLKNLPTEPNDGYFSYHKQMNLIAKTIEDFEDIIYRGLKDGRIIQVKFDNSNLYNEAVKNLDDIVNKSVTKLNKNYSKYSILYYEENNILVLSDFIEN